MDEDDGPGWEQQQETEQQQWESEMDTKETLYKALSGFQSEVGAIPFDSVNPHFKSKYASLAAIWEKIRPGLKKHGLAVTQTFFQGNDTVFCVTRLAHESGQYIDSQLPVLAQDKSPQKLGSGITYARRYGLSAILGLVADEDDDANSAQAPAAKPKAPPKEKPKPANESTVLDFQAQIDDCKTTKEMHDVAKQIALLDAGTKAALRSYYDAKLTQLKGTAA